MSIREIRLSFIAAITASAVMWSCSTTTGTNDQITNAVKVATEQAILHVPKEFQTPLADYIEVGAKGVYSINGEPTVQELTAKVIAFIPKDVQDKYPLIVTAITGTVASMYAVFGKSALTAIGKGLEAGAAPYITK